MDHFEKLRRRTSAGVTLSSVTLAAFGILLLFAPDEVSRALAQSSSDNVLVLVTAAAVLGLAAMNWTARGSALAASMAGQLSSATRRTR